MTTAEKTKPSRLYYMDLMRIIACFLVVMTHSMMKNKPENGIWLAMISFLCSPSSEMFLMLSGAILLPVKTDMGSFYKRRFKKLLPPMFFWSVFCIILDYVKHRTTIQDSILNFVCLPFKPVIGVYWFLYVMIGLYLLAPFLSTWLNQAPKRQIEFVIGIWLFTMFVPWLNLLIPDFYCQDGSYYWPYCYFGGFLGYWLLGYYLRNYPPKLISKVGLSALVGSIVYGGSVILLHLRNIDASDYFDNLQIGSVFLIVLLFILVKWFSETEFAQRKLNRIASNIAQYTFGIYLMHIYVVRDFVKAIMNQHRMYNHPVFETLIITIVSIAICVVVINITARVSTKLGKWLFGYSRV